MRWRAFDTARDHSAAPLTLSVRSVPDNHDVESFLTRWPTSQRSGRRKTANRLGMKIGKVRGGDHRDNVDAAIAGCRPSMIVCSGRIGSDIRFGDSEIGVDTRSIGCVHGFIVPLTRVRGTIKYCPIDQMDAKAYQGPSVKSRDGAVPLKVCENGSGFDLTHQPS